ncbi:MAG: aldehyde dehydrogenase family protein [Candidatus Binataceae bacterium]
MAIPESVSRFLAAKSGLLIGGKITAPLEGRFFDVENPATEQKLAEAPFASAADVAKAVEAAETAFRKWRQESPVVRARVLRDFAKLLRENAGELGYLDALDGGNPVHAMTQDALGAAAACEYFAGLALEIKGQTIPGEADFIHCTFREPYGVVGKIIPFNHPIMFAGAKLAAPLIAGNTVVMKPAEQTPMSALRMAELARDVFPPGTVNIVTGDGPTTGRAIVTHPGIKRLALTGSVETGKAISQQAAEGGIKNITLELGGKNPMIIFPDVEDMDRAVEGAVGGMNFTWCQGQSCGSTSRLFLHSGIHDIFLERLIARAKKVRIGDPADGATEMGCLVSRAQFDKSLKYIEAGKREGAELRIGGGRPEQFGKGYFIAPTVFAGVKPSMSIAREEIFGPVLSVFKWDREEEVINQANGVQYGLTASIWTRDISKAARFARSLEAGFIWINASSRHFTGVPFGGYKQSGIGNEESLGELLSYTQTKAVNIHVAI